MIKKVGILTNGGDCPGLNAVIRAIVKTADEKGVECYGFIEGYKGLLNKDYMKLDSNVTASGILHKGGTIIGSSNNVNVFNLKVEKDGQVEYVDMSQKCIDNIKEMELDCLFTLGGDGTQKSARDFSTRGVNVIGIPKTIDNDVACTDATFGFNTAVSVATEALDRLHTTAESHHRIMVLEVMGRYTGWIALESGIAGGADVILIPEIPYDINKVAAKIEERKAMGKNFSVVVVAEGAKPIDGDIVVKRTVETGGKGLESIRLGGIGDKISAELEHMTGLESRNTLLGYVQRGGSPTATDRILSTKYGAKAMELALEEKFNVLVVLNGNKLDYVSLEDVVGDNKEIGAVSGNTKETNMKRVTLNHDLVKTAENIGICLGR